MKIECIPVGFLQANCYIVCDDQRRAAVIDPGDEPERILAHIEANDILVEKILITHGHFDHTGAVGDLLRAVSGARLVMNPDDRVVMPTDIEIDEAVRDGDVVAVGDLAFAVVATPGHSPGGVCYLCEDALFSGDTLFYDSIGRSDLPGGDTDVLVRSLQRLLGIEREMTIYPGHGPATTLARERAENPFLQ